MTYDELLAEVKLRQGMEMGLYAFKAWLALSAVVELHKPYDWHPGCAQCGYYQYPCPTIQAIEKELN